MTNADDAGNDQSEFVRSLKTEAASLSNEELVAGLNGTVDDFHAVSSKIPESAWATTPAADEWSAAQCFQHVTALNIALSKQALYVALSGDNPGYSEDTEFESEREVAGARHREAIASLFAHIEAAGPTDFLEATWSLGALGPLNWREWIVFLRTHTEEHAGQLRNLNL